MSANFTPEQKDYKSYQSFGTFRLFVLENFPFIAEDFDALTYYQMLCKVVGYLNDVITNNESLQYNQTELLDAFNELQSYVNTYFDNLDLQTEINNKLDQMAQDGTLQEIIADYLDTQAIFCYDTVNDMKQATNLINGSYTKTLGYYSKNDGGSGLYKIRTFTTSDVIDEGKIIKISENLIAELIIINNTINPKQFGAIGDNLTDDSINLLKCFTAFNNVTIDLLNLTYNATTMNSFTFPENITLINGTLNIDEIIMRNSSGLLSLINVNINAKSYNDYGNNQKFIIFSETNDEGSLYLDNCKIISDVNNTINNKVCIIYLKDYKNVTILNSYLENKHNTDVGGCIWLSNYNKNRENVVIKNNTLINNTKDETLALYDTIAGKNNIITNNIIEGKNPSFTVNFYKALAENTLFTNNIIKSNSTEISIQNITNNNPITVNDNIMVHNAGNQESDGKSGLYSTYSHLEAKNNTFKAINYNNVSYKVQPCNMSNNIMDSWTVLFENNDTHNNSGVAKDRINCYFNELYSIFGEFKNCIIKTDTAKMSNNIKALNSHFEITNCVTGYATGESYFKNCVGGKFANNGVLSSLIIENSSVNYGYGSETNYVNNQSRLNAASSAGHIFYSSMNNQAINNITHSA